MFKFTDAKTRVKLAFEKIKDAHEDLGTAMDACKDSMENELETSRRAQERAKHYEDYMLIAQGVILSSKIEDFNKRIDHGQE